MIFEVIYEKPHNNWCVNNVYDNIFNELVKKYKNHIFKHINTTSFYPVGPGEYYSPHLMVIKNPLNKKYILLSYWDISDDLFLEQNGWKNIDDLTQFISTSGLAYKHKKNIPFSYITYSTDMENIINELYNKNYLDISHKLCFRGYLYNFRLYLKNNSDIFVTNDKLIPYDYLLELKKHKIGLSLNGNGEICNRDIEILGLGVPLLRPVLKCKFYTPLIPDYHYISYNETSSYEETKHNLITKYEEIKNNDEYLRFISNNGRKWYEQNGTLLSNVQLAIKIINLNTLI